MSAAIDADQAIIAWCGNLAVPKEANESWVTTCPSCTERIDGLIRSGKRHSCRLCGKYYCSACTAKYHVPLIFRTKGKDGPQRVCLPCVDGCMKQKAKSLATISSLTGDAAATGAKVGYASAVATSSLSSTTLSASLMSMSSTRVVHEIAPPDFWESEATYKACPKCATTKKVKTHNCRACGVLYCEKCTSKIDMLPCFERKKGKENAPMRACDACRYKVVSGNAKFVETLSKQAIALNQQAALTSAAPILSAGIARKTDPAAAALAAYVPVVVMCPALGCALPASELKDGSLSTHCALHTALLQSVQVEIRREIPADIFIGQDVSYASLATLTLPSIDSSLAHIDKLLRQSAPPSDAYSYMFRGQALPEAFFTVFTARHLGLLLTIRPKFGWDDGTGMVGSRTGAGGGTVAGSRAGTISMMRGGGTIIGAFGIRQSVSGPQQDEIEEEDSPFKIASQPILDVDDEKYEDIVVVAGAVPIVNADGRTSPVKRQLRVAAPPTPVGPTRSASLFTRPRIAAAKVAPPKRLPPPPPPKRGAPPPPLPGQSPSSPSSSSSSSSAADDSGGSKSFDGDLEEEFKRRAKLYFGQLE